MRGIIMNKKIYMLFFAAILMVFLAACGFNNDDSSSNANDNNNAENDNTLNTSDNNNDGDSEGAADGVVNLHTSSEIPTADSSHAHDSAGFTTLNNTNEGLYRSDASHLPQLAMAEEHETNDDETVHTFTIRDANWENGDPVTANDFEY